MSSFSDVCGMPANLVAVECGDFLRMKFPDRPYFLKPWLQKQGLAMVHSYRGIGKTHFSLGVAVAVATGSAFLNFVAEKPRGVLFVDGEMSATSIQSRLKAMLPVDSLYSDFPLRIITPDLQPEGMPDLSTREGQEAIGEYIDDSIDLIIIDNLATLCGGMVENKNEAFAPVKFWCLRQRAAGKAVLLVHHDGKSGQQRGCSSKEDPLDVVIHLKRPSNYSPTEGAVFEVHYSKYRELYGEDVEPFEATLKTVDGKNNWKINTLESSALKHVRRLFKEGYKQSDIVAELGYSKGYVSKLIKKIKSLE